MLETIGLDIPYMLLSTHVTNIGETEKRIFTPFGVLDVTFRSLPFPDTHVPCFEIEVDGDTENWIFSECVVNEFKNTLINFVLGIFERYWGRQARNDLKELSVYIKGARLKILVPWP
jgi:hypothetical protein